MPIKKPTGPPPPAASRSRPSIRQSCRSVARSVARSLAQSIDRSVSPSLGRSVRLSVGQSVSLEMWWVGGSPAACVPLLVESSRSIFRVKGWVGGWRGYRSVCLSVSIEPSRLVISPSIV